MYVHPNIDKHHLSIEFARKFMEEKLIERFNDLAQTARLLGEKVYENRWNNMLEKETIPERISPSNPR